MWVTPMALCCLFYLKPTCASSIDEMRRDFVFPPNAAKPFVWWHWMNGNVTTEGIDLDLHWMQRIGIGGLHNFEGSLYTPEVVDRRILFMTPAWQDVFRHAVESADSLGLQFGISATPGWSSAGGPWVAPEEAMKKLVWSETQVEGGTPFVGKIPLPPSIAGPFQDVPWSHPVPGLPLTGAPAVYHDVAIVAYRRPFGDRALRDLNPSVTSSAGEIDSEKLWDGRFQTTVQLPFDGSRSAWIALDFHHPLTIRSMSLALQENSDFVPSHVAAVLQSSQDGVRYRTIASVWNTSAVQQTVTFPAVTSRYFRLSLPTPPKADLPSIFSRFAAPVQTEHRVAEFVLYPVARVSNFESKAGFFAGSGVDDSLTPSVTPRDAISRNDVLDLTTHLRADGTLDWNVPRGNWTILRFGYSLLGTMNRPALSELTGLEVDKLSRASVKRYFESYLGQFESATGPALFGHRGLSSVVEDSWEVGAQNWTEALPTEFARRRGYELMPWLPVLAGHVIASSEASEAFLWDYRHTLEELIIENYFDQVTTLLHVRGLIHYAESHEAGRALMADGMDIKRVVDVPMGAMWANEKLVSRAQSDADLLETASVSHIYGKSLVAAESMTTVGLPGAAYSYGPADLKPIADREMVDGVNRFVLHTSVHQPLTREGPGVGLGAFGQWFTRNETWADLASGWTSYLARSSYLLQQGIVVADILYYYGEDSNITALYGRHLPDIPPGYAFDFANSDVLKQLSVRAGNLITNSGMRYRILVLDPRNRVMPLEVLRRIARLVAEGATVVGKMPTRSPSLADDAGAFRALANSLWGTKGSYSHAYGRGFILGGDRLKNVLGRVGSEPDFSYSISPANASLAFVHRKLQNGDLYFVRNESSEVVNAEAKFRVGGRAVELWHADTGATERTSYRQEGTSTIIPLVLGPYEAVFVLFGEPTTQRELNVARSVRETVVRVAGPWQIHFQSGRGAPEQTTYTDLRSWTADADAGIRYFSGVADYQTTFDAPTPENGTHPRTEIDLGVVRDVAEVLLNGKSVGIAWKPPYRLDITDALMSGRNHITIRIANLWRNRLIGDKQPGTKALAFTTFNPYSAESPLLESGLLGPVTLQRVRLAAP